MVNPHQEYKLKSARNGKIIFSTPTFPNKIIKENASGIPAKLAAKLETKVIFSCNLVDRFIKHKHKINVPINPITLELTAISTLLTKACV